MGIINYFKELKSSIDSIKSFFEREDTYRPIIVTGRIDGSKGIGSFYGETKGISCKIIKSYNHTNNDGSYGKAKIQFIFDLDTHKYIEIPLSNVYDDESLKVYSRNFPVQVQSVSGEKIIIELTDLPEYLLDSQRCQKLKQIDIILKDDGILKIRIFINSHLF